MNEQTSSNLLQEVIERFSDWQHTGLMPLANISGYAGFLLSGQFGPLTDEQRQAVEIILHSSWHEAECWQQPGAYLRLRFGQERVNLGSISLSEVITQALTWLNHPRKINAQVLIPENLPTIKGDCWWLAMAITGCITDWYHPSGRYHKDFTHAIEATPTDNVILVQVRTGLREKQSERALYYPGTGIELAKLVVEQHGSQLALEWSHQEAKISFTLLPWHSEL